MDRPPGVPALNSHVVLLLKTFSRGASVTTIAVGLAVLVGWALDIAFLKSLSTGLASMKANTALAFILSGLSLWLLQTEQADQRSRRAAQVCASIAALIGLLTLSEYLFGWDLGIDQLLFKEPAGAPETFFPGRMAPITALNFFLVGSALLLLDVETRRGHRPAQFVTLVAASLNEAFLKPYQAVLNADEDTLRLVSLVAGNPSSGGRGRTQKEA